MTSRIGFLISMFGTRMCGQTLLFIVIANGAIEMAPYMAVQGMSIHVCRICTNPERDVLNFGGNPDHITLRLGLGWGWD